MEIDEDKALLESMDTSSDRKSGPNVMASSTTIPSVTISLHPLVVMNISEHWTRIRAQEGARKQGKFIKIF